MADLQKSQSRLKCRRMLENFDYSDFILGEELYFTPGNNSQPWKGSF